MTIPRQFNNRAMRDIITISRMDFIEDAYHQPVETPVDVFTDIPAHVFVGGSPSDSFRGSTQEEVAARVFRIRYVDGIEPTYTVIHAGRRYGVVDVQVVDDGNGRKWLDIVAKVEK